MDARHTNNGKAGPVIGIVGNGLRRQLLITLHEKTLWDADISMTDDEALRNAATIVSVRLNGILSVEAAFSQLMKFRAASLSSCPLPAGNDDDDSLLISAYDLVTTYTELDPPVIHGVLREGETMNLIASPKMNKSWLANDLALSVITGQKWLGTFDTTPGKVLIVDNELNRKVISDRLRKIAAARNVSIGECLRMIDFYTVRGRAKDLNDIGKRLQKYGPGTIKLAIVDAWYRALPEGTDENDNADVAKAYNLVDRLALDFGCAFVLIHHASKGNQSAKGITDVGSGAGSQSRAADTHVILRPHREPGVAVLEAVVRSWAPIAPRCIRWRFPTWEIEESLDPSELKRETPGRQAESSVPDQISRDAKKLIEILKSLNQPITSRQLRLRAKINSDRFELAFENIADRITEIDCFGKNGRSYRGVILNET